MSDDVLRGLRKRIIEVAASAGEGHVPSSLSVLEILWTLYDQVMGPNDQFVLSKGHASLALYAVLEAKGKIPADWDGHFCRQGSPLMGHPERAPELGIEATTGSLGHGLPIAAGMALAKKIKSEPGRVFCVVGDGELNEGSCFEAALCAARHRLANLTVLVDANASDVNEIDGERFTADIPSKFRAFGWRTCRSNGHDCRMIQRMAEFSGGNEPLCIVADTQKGRGVPAMEADPQQWHHRVPTREQAREMCEGL